MEYMMWYTEIQPVYRSCSQFMKHTTNNTEYNLTMILSIFSLHTAMVWSQYQRIARTYLPLEGQISLKCVHKTRICYVFTCAVNLHFKLKLQYNKMKFLLVILGQHSKIRVYFQTELIHTLKLNKTKFLPARFLGMFTKLHGTVLKIRHFSQI